MTLKYVSRAFHNITYQQVKVDVLLEISSLYKWHACTKRTKKQQRLLSLQIVIKFLIQRRKLKACIQGADFILHSYDISNGVSKCFVRYEVKCQSLSLISCKNQSLIWYSVCTVHSIPWFNLSKHESAFQASKTK